MDLAEYVRFDGLGLAELIRKKEVSPKELAELMAAGIEKLNPSIGVKSAVDCYSVI